MNEPLFHQGHTICLPLFGTFLGHGGISFDSPVLQYLLFSPLVQLQPVQARGSRAGSLLRLKCTTNTFRKCSYCKSCLLVRCTVIFCKGNIAFYTDTPTIYIYITTKNTPHENEIDVQHTLVWGNLYPMTYIF